MELIQLTSDVLDPVGARDLIKSYKAGAECQFLGTVRNYRNEKTVKYLYFEAYEAMAIKELNKISEQARDAFDIHEILIHHRLGKVEIGGFAVLIIVSAPHRKAAFEACQYAIDTLKMTVPIWKKEVMSDGEIWVSAHP